MGLVCHKSLSTAHIKKKNNSLPFESTQTLDKSTAPKSFLLHHK